jgi:cell division protein ZapA
MSDSAQTKSIRVQILGRKYALRVREKDEAHTRRVAASLDARMHQFSQEHPEQAELTTAVMTALSLAEELCLQREQHDDDASALADELDMLAQRLAEAAPDSPDDGDDDLSIGTNGTP